MKVIRQGVFETNSSSSHSISIAGGAASYTQSIGVHPDGSITLGEGEYGWGYERFNDCASKADYCSIDTRGNPARREMLDKVLKKHTGARKIIHKTDDDKDGGYIDHQSYGTSGEAFKSEETLKQFLFNPASGMIIDNDNH
jgi:hypothetical protein